MGGPPSAALPEQLTWGGVLSRTSLWSTPAHMALPFLREWLARERSPPSCASTTRGQQRPQGEGATEGWGPIMPPPVATGMIKYQEDKDVKDVLILDTHKKG